MALCRYQMVLQPVLTEIKKLKSVRKQSNSGTFTLQKILEKTRKYLVLPPPSPHLLSRGHRRNSGGCVSAGHLTLLLT